MSPDSQEPKPTMFPDPEAQPLASYTDGSEEDDGHGASSDGSAPTRRKRRSPRRALLVAGALVCTGLVSAGLGACLRDRLADLDAVCAAHTTHYCESI